MNKKEKKEKQENPQSKLDALEKEFGLKKASSLKQVENIRTGIYAFDYVLDNGLKLAEGGHKIELYGRESSGKTTFALYTVKRYQELGKTCVWVVSESFRENWAKQLGVDTDKLLLAYPKTVEDAGEKLLQLIPKVDLIVVDSVASLIPEAELERAINEPTRGGSAKAYSLICRKIYQIIPNLQTTMIFINQIREKMGVIYGNPETTPGGKALKHMYDTRIEFRAGKSIDIGTKEKKERIGIEINLFGKKNKLGVPQRKAVVDFYFTGKVDNRKSLLFAGLKYSIITLAGKTYSYNDKKAVGKDNFVASLSDKEWKKVSEEIWKRMK